MNIEDLDTRSVTRYILDEKVFDLDVCPDWAEWAAVDSDGYVFLYDKRPFCATRMWMRAYSGKAVILDSIALFDATDWKHSLIERPNKALEVTMSDLEKKFGCKVKIVKEL